MIIYKVYKSLSVLDVTWVGQLQLHPPELRHGRLQLIHHKVVLEEEVFGQRHLQELHQLLHGQLHQLEDGVGHGGQHALPLQDVDVPDPEGEGEGSLQGEEEEEEEELRRWRFSLGIVFLRMRSWCSWKRISFGKPGMKNPNTGKGEREREKERERERDDQWSRF
ncbi:hypothetical protein EYF80_018515 [Liparis tanakae]|uniref:Uncharacterized protein n=1 Tax=Liparis tanakae TaxID=230148 RepID=A0A4Z2HZL8_9TELE|nr:hypothetical protein EYF80_018515 [Liparis tanakae]